MKCPEAIILSVTAAAAAVADKLTVQEIELLSAVATQFADTLATLALLKSEGE